MDVIFVGHDWAEDHHDVAVLDEAGGQLAQARLAEGLADAESYLRLPGLGYVLAARVLAEFGDDPNRYHSAKARRSYAGTAPITRQSGKATLVTVRRQRNQHLADTCCRWAFCSLSSSPGVRAYYDAMRDRNLDHQGALFRVANRWVSILHHLLDTGADYDETAACANWLPADDAPNSTDAVATADAVTEESEEAA